MQRSSCACVGAYIFDTHPRCRKHSSGLDCQYFAPYVAGFKCCDICAQWSTEQWVAFRRSPRTYASRIMSSKKTSTSDKKLEIASTKQVKKDPPKKTYAKSKSVPIGSPDATVKSPAKLALPIITPIQIVVPPSTISQHVDNVVVTSQPGPVSTQIVAESSSQALTVSCGLANVDLSRPEVMFSVLQSLFQTMGVKPVGVTEQPVAFTGVYPWEAIKGRAGSSPPIHRLT
jgi:hypothetical protein